jgi:hypothetical protein
MKILHSFKKYMIKMPWFSFLLKWVLVLSLSLFFIVGFMAKPLEIKRIWLDREVVPMNDSFYVKTISIKPWTSIIFCTATEARLHVEITTLSGEKLQLGSLPEPFGFNRSAAANQFTIRHQMPTGLKVGETIRVWKTVSYECLGIPRTVVSPSATFIVGEPVNLENSGSDQIFRTEPNLRSRIVPDNPGSMRYRGTLE